MKRSHAGSRPGEKLREIRTGRDDLAVVQETQRISEAIFGGQLMGDPIGSTRPGGGHLAFTGVHAKTLAARIVAAPPKDPSGTKALAAWPAGHLHNRAARGGTRRATRPLGVDPKTVRRYISQGRLKAVRVGPRLIRTERESLESLGKPVGGAQ